MNQKFQILYEILINNNLKNKLHRIILIKKLIDQNQIQYIQF